MHTNGYKTRKRGKKEISERKPQTTYNTLLGEVLWKGREILVVLLLPCPSAQDQTFTMRVQRGVQRPASWKEANLSIKPLQKKTWYWQKTTLWQNSALNYPIDNDWDKSWPIFLLGKTKHIGQDLRLARLNQTPHGQCTLNAFYKLNAQKIMSIIWHITWSNSRIHWFPLEPPPPSHQNTPHWNQNMVEEVHLGNK